MWEGVQTGKLHLVHFFLLRFLHRHVCIIHALASVLHLLCEAFGLSGQFFGVFNGAADIVIGVQVVLKVVNAIVRQLLPQLCRKSPIIIRTRIIMGIIFGVYLNGMVVVLNPMFSSSRFQKVKMQLCTSRRNMYLSICTVT